MTAPLTLRPHHLLCLQGFQGSGYSPAFVANFQNLVDQLTRQPDRDCEVVTVTDAICEPCPHRDGLRCGKDPDAERRIQDTDRRVLHKLGLASGSRGPADAMLELVNNKLQTTADVAEICGTCPWTGICRWYQSRIVV